MKEKDAVVEHRLNLQLLMYHRWQRCKPLKHGESIVQVSTIIIIIIIDNVNVNLNIITTIVTMNTNITGKAAREMFHKVLALEQSKNKIKIKILNYAPGMDG